MDALDRNQKDYRNLILALRKVRKTKEGRIIWDFLKHYCGITKPIFDHDGNATRAALKEGKRLVALQLIHIHNDNPDPAILASRVTKEKKKWNQNENE